MPEVRVQDLHTGRIGSVSMPDWETATVEDLRRACHEALGVAALGIASPEGIIMSCAGRRMVALRKRAADFGVEPGATIYVNHHGAEAPRAFGVALAEGAAAADPGRVAVAVTVRVHAGATVTEHRVSIVAAEETSEDLKRRLWSRTGFAAHEACLVAPGMPGSGTILRDTGATLASHGVRDGACLDLFPSEAAAHRSPVRIVPPAAYVPGLQQALRPVGEAVRRDWFFLNGPQERPIGRGFWIPYGEALSAHLSASLEAMEGTGRSEGRVLDLATVTNGASGYEVCVARGRERKVRMQDTLHAYA